MKRTIHPLSERECYEILRQIDIKTAIDYFGVIELLDHIDDAVIKSYLMNQEMTMLMERRCPNEIESREDKR